MKYFKCILYLTTILVIISCSNSNSSEIPTAKEIMMDIKLEEQAENVEIERKLIKTGRIEYEVSKLEIAKKNILVNVKKHKSYISSDQEFKSDWRISNTIIIRVPTNNFDNLLNDITKGITQFDEKEIKIKDVTEEFLDVEARLKTKKKIRSQLS